MTMMRVWVSLGTLVSAVLLAGCTDAAAPQASVTSVAPSTVPTGSQAPAGSATSDVDGPVDIGGGRSIYLHCTGQGSPTVILESGYHDASTLWSEAEPEPPAVGPAVQERLAQHVRVCSYDRPGTIVYSSPPALTDRTTPVSMPRSASAAIADLRTLVAVARLTTPLVIVAHSMGGLLARLYAATYPDQVAGLVFVDAFPVEIRASMGSLWPRYEKVLAHPGTAFDTDPRFEVLDVDASIDQISAAPPLKVMPMAVISKTLPFPLPTESSDLASPLEEAWSAGQESLVALGHNTPHIVATGSDHYVHVRQPDLVAATTMLVISRITTP